MITEPDHFSIFKEDWKSWVLCLWKHSNFDFILNVNSLKTVTVVYFNFPNFPQYLITCTLEQRQPTTRKHSSRMHTARFETVRASGGGGLGRSWNEQAWDNTAQWRQGKVTNLKTMVLGHCTILLDHVIIMRKSYFDTNFTSQMKLTKLPSIHCFEPTASSKCAACNTTFQTTPKETISAKFTYV